MFTNAICQLLLYVILRNSNEIVNSHITQVHTILSHKGDIFKNLYSRSWSYSYMNSDLKSPQIGDSTHFLPYVVSLILYSHVFLTRIPSPLHCLVQYYFHHHHIHTMVHFSVYFSFSLDCEALWNRLSLVYLYYQKNQQAWLLSTHFLKGIRRGMGLIPLRIINISER